MTAKCNKMMIKILRMIDDLFNMIKYMHLSLEDGSRASDMAGPGNIHRTSVSCDKVKMCT